MKIKVISGFEGNCDFSEPFLKTVGEYCGKFGYEFIPNHGNKGEIFKHRNGFWWGKLYLVEKYLHDCDYVLWIDTDCICINFEKRIEDLLTSDFDILMTKEDVPESGVMLFNNS
jgi:citrate lyase synthetase